VDLTTAQEVNVKKTFISTEGLLATGTFISGCFGKVVDAFQ
jgi:hypothetical protein